MNIRITLLAAACALTLSACGDKSAESATPVAPAATTSEAAPEAAPEVAPSPAAPAAAAPGNDIPAAVVTDCATVIEGNDAMQFDVGSITVPASCTSFTITLKHTGQMPAASMGHNVVIAKVADMQGVNADGAAAGAAAAYVKAGDARVVAHTGVVGGGQTTTVSFPVAGIQGDGPYAFFCSFPGHSALMKGNITVG